jgi:DNA-binding CsgD family transcriptional regulator
MLAWAGRFVEAKQQPELSVATGDAAVEVGASWSAGFVNALEGDVDAARRGFEQTRAGFESLGQHRLLAFAVRDELTYLVIPYLAEDLDERAHVAAAARHAVEQGAAAGALDEPAVYSQYPVLPLMILEGRWIEARQAIDVLRDYGGSAIFERVLNSFLGPLAREQGEPELAWRLVRETWPGGPDTDFDHADIYYSLPMLRLAAALALDEEDPDTARAWLEAHDRWLDRSGAVLGRSDGASLWARYFSRTGEPQRARELAERAVAYAAKPRQPLALLVAHRVVGRLETRAARFDEADAHLGAALALSEAIGAPHDKARTLIALAELRLAEGHPERASVALAQAQTICRTMGATRTLTRAEALIAELGRRGSSTPVRPAGLTARESQVLGLLARGHSNKEIAERLHLSARTVERHITTAYRKIGVHRRTEAMAFALLHGLARVDDDQPPPPA